MIKVVNIHFYMGSL